MSARGAAKLAWLAFAVAASLAVAALVLRLTLAPEAFSLRDGVASLTYPITASALGALIVSRQPRNRIGWLLVLSALYAGAAFAGLAYATIEPPPPGREWAAWVASPLAVAFGAVAFLLLLFPNGRLPSSRWRWVALVNALAMALLFVGTALPPRFGDFPDIQNPVGIQALEGSPLEGGEAGWGLLILGMSASATALVVRFRRSRGEERQQLKWLVLAAVLIAAGFVLLSAGAQLTGAAGALVGVPFLASLVFLPIAVGLAVLRHGLYEVDLVINKGLVYGLLTALLVGVYAGLTIGLGAAFEGITGQSSGLAVAISTLAVAALFRPARSKIQDLIDRRFYRRKYDAARALEEFSATLRDEVDLDALNRELVAVVEETMQPAHVSVWLRSPEAEG